MADKDQQSDSAEPTPLNRNEVAAMAGAGAVVVGTLLPALQPGFGETQSLLRCANTATIAFWGFAGSVIWSVTRRRAHEAAGPGVLILLCLLLLGIFVWLENVREPLETLFGSLRAEFRPAAWAVTGIGSAVTLFVGLRSRARQACLRFSPQSHGSIRVVGVTLAVLGCLMGLSLVNPFGGWAPVDFRRLSRTYEDELRLLRWLCLGSATFCIVACFQYPERATRVLQKVIQVAVLIISAGIFVVLSLAAPQTRLLATLIGAAWAVLSISFWFTKQPSSALDRCKALVVASPFIAVAGLLMMMGEVEDLVLFLYPLLAVATGYVICRNTKHANIAIFASALTIGLPAGLMALRGVDGMISDVLGLSVAEARLGATGICCLLGWAVVLSLKNARVVSSDVAAVKPEPDLSDRSEMQ